MALAIQEKDVAFLVENVMPNRKGSQLAQQHPDLAVFKAWYSGRTDWHKYVVQNNKGEDVVKERLSSCIGKMGCEALANNYANENLQITIPKEKEQEEIERVFMRNKFIKNFGSL